MESYLAFSCDDFIQYTVGWLDLNYSVKFSTSGLKNWGKLINLHWKNGQSEI